MPAEDGFHEIGRRILETLMAHPGEFGVPMPIDGLPSPPILPGLPEFVLESEAALFLGNPPARSLSLAVPLAARDVGDGLAWTFGMSPVDAAARNQGCDFLQILLVESSEPITRPFLSGVSSLRSLAGRLPGYLAHSVGDETTGRIHHGLLAAGLNHQHLAKAHLIQARARGFAGTVFVAVGIPSSRAFDLLAPFADELRHRNADLSAAARTIGDRSDGCQGRVCGDCDERDVCDKVRAVLKAYPKG